MAEIDKGLPNTRTEIDRSGAAGGGIAKLAGIESGPQRVSMNPDSEGLASLLKRGR